jgi:hypothetical protein
LHAYIIDSSLLLFSEKSECVYGFEKETAALFLEIDSLVAAAKDKKEILEMFPSLSQELITELYTLAASAENLPKESYGQKLPRVEYVYDGLPRTCYVANGLSFAVNYPHAAIYKHLHPVFEHLASDLPTGECIAVDFQAQDGRWQLLFDKIPLAYPVDLAMLALILQENMITALYQSRPHLIAMHAAAVGFAEALFILPAVSGSGKTTLSAALMKEGFELYSDEISRLDMQGRVDALPFALNIKEGSWSVLEKSYPSLAYAPSHLRFDAQRVRFLQPESSGMPPRKPTHLVFPKYRAGAATRLLPLSACEAMQWITEGGYQLDAPLNAARFEGIASALMELPKFALEYASLSEAIELFKELALEKT